MLSDSFLSEILENFIANVCNIMQALPECLELLHSLDNFTLGNQTKHIMKKNADKSKEIHRQQETRWWQSNLCVQGKEDIAVSSIGQLQQSDVVGTCSRLVV